MPELSTHLQTDDLKHKISMRIAQMEREDLQRAGGSTSNEPEIQGLSQIEQIILNPETYNPMTLSAHTIADKLERYGVITSAEKENLLNAMRGTRAKPFTPST